MNSMIRESGKEKVVVIPTSYDEDKARALNDARFWWGSMIMAFYEIEIHGGWV